MKFGAACVLRGLGLRAAYADHIRWVACQVRRLGECCRRLHGEEGGPEGRHRDHLNHPFGALRVLLEALEGAAVEEEAL